MNGTIVEEGDVPIISFGWWIDVEDLYGRFFVPYEAGTTIEAVSNYAKLENDNEVRCIGPNPTIGYGCRWEDWRDPYTNRCWIVFKTLNQAEDHLYAMTQDSPKWAIAISDAGEIAMKEAQDYGHKEE